MSNSFNISVSPEIAALEAKVDIIDTIVDDIRDVDLPAHDTKLTTVDTVVDQIRDIDVPNIQSNIDANETKIDTIDGIVDAIKLKTDATPQNVRGSYIRIRGAMASDTYTPLVDVTGHGILYNLIIGLENNLDTVEMLLTLDGTAWSSITHTGDLIGQALVPVVDILPSDTFRKVPCPPDEPVLLFLEFNTSLLIQYRRTPGILAAAYCKAQYFLDDF